MTIPNLNSKNIQAFDIGIVEPKFGQEHTFIVYAPLSGLCFLSDSVVLQKLEDIAGMKTNAVNQKVDALKKTLEMLEDTSELKKMLSDTEPTVITNPSQFTKLSILPNLRCNFACTYCYSAKGRSNSELSIDKLKTMLDYFMDHNRTTSRNRTIFISGGGEPLLSPNIIMTTIQYSRRLAKEKNLNLELLLMTNGSLITKSFAKKLEEHKVQIGVSFEILPDVQNSQRGYYKEVESAIKNLSQLGMTPSLSSVITNSNVDRMSEMAQRVIDGYPEVRHLNFDPAMISDSFQSTRQLDHFYDCFIKNFFEAKRLCGKHGITLDCNAIRHMEKLFPRYCQGKLCLVPSGEITVCHTVSSPKEVGYEQYIYGRVTDDGVKFDNEKFETLVSNDILPVECNSCIARWHCGGGCLMYRTRYTDKKMKSVCRFTRHMAAIILLAKINTEYRHKHGKNLIDIIKNHDGLYKS